MAALVFWPSYSSSESIQPYFGTTPNAASGGNTWSMDSILPTPPGLDINGVIYNYTIQKNVEDSAKVHVQNENANGTGYIFREIDEWQAGSLGGTEIRKVVPVIPNLSRELWGNGSIEIEGSATIEDPNVVYMYKVDPCYDPQFDPNCPGYQVQIPDIPQIDVTDIYDATEDEYVTLSSDEQVLLEENEEVLDNEEEKEKQEAEKRKRQYRLELALSVRDNSEMFANSFVQAQQLAALDIAIRASQYYSLTIPGGTYKDSHQLVDKKIEDNKKGLRNNFAQQLLHEQMVQEQYNN
jgi:hypothetical protein